MKISSKTSHGIQIMCFLANNFKNGLQSVSEIAKFAECGEKYAEKLLGVLKNANLIVAVRGKLGGYKLINSPSVITLGQILKCLDDDFKFNNEENEKNNSPHQFVFNKINKNIEKFIESVTLQDLIDNKGEK